MRVVMGDGALFGTRHCMLDGPFYEVLGAFVLSGVFFCTRAKLAGSGGEGYFTPLDLDTSIGGGKPTLTVVAGLGCDLRVWRNEFTLCYVWSRRC